jgi:hypothetical protein
LIDFLKNINVLGLRIDHHELHVCHSMLLEKQDL